MTPKITVCDDETKIIEDIKRIIEKEIPDAEISAYTDVDSLLKGMEEDNYDIVLLASICRELKIPFAGFGPVKGDISHS